MSNINYDFDIPYYVFEEIVEYASINSSSEDKFFKWNNIKILLNMAVANDRLSYEQAEYIKNKFKNL